MRYRRRIFYLLLVFVTTNFFLIVTYQSRRIIIYQPHNTNTSKPRTIPESRAKNKPQSQQSGIVFRKQGLEKEINTNATNYTMSKLHGYMELDETVHQFRKDVVRLIHSFVNNSGSVGVRKIVRRESLMYPAFQVTEPKFINIESKQLFYKDQRNRERIGIPTKDQLLGDIVTVRKGTFSMPHDCGYRSNVSHVLKPRAILPGRWFRSLVPMIVPDGGTFQHFIDGTLPKIIQALEYIQRSQVKLLMPPIRDTVIYEILEKLNISRGKIVTYSGGSIGADYLIYTCVTPPIHPLLWQKARSLLGIPDKLAIPRTRASIVVITRRGCFNCGRRLLNKDMLLSKLKTKYSNVIEFRGPLSLAETVSLFGSTSVIIGVHGGGLYNINFCPSNTTVIEIMPTKPDGTVIAAAHQIFWTQSVLLDHDYWRISAAPANDKGDVRVNITLVENIIDKSWKS